MGPMGGSSMIGKLPRKPQPNLGSIWGSLYDHEVLGDSMALVFLSPTKAPIYKPRIRYGSIRILGGGTLKGSIRVP